MKKLLLLVGLVVFSFSAKSEEYFCESKKNGNVYKSPVGCFNNITLTEEEFLSKSDKLIEYTPICEKNKWDAMSRVQYNKKCCSENKEQRGEINDEGYWQCIQGKKITMSIPDDMKSSDGSVKAGCEGVFQYSFSSKKSCKRAQKYRKDNFSLLLSSRRDLINRTCNPREIDCWSLTNYQQPNKLSSYDEFALALGCGSKRDNVDDCVRRWLPSIIESGPLTMEQINEVKKDASLMGEIVFAIEEMARADTQSTNQEQEQAQQTEGYYKEQSNGQFVWVDTRSGAEKFSDKFCFNCTSAQVYMINRATKKYFQGAPLSGFDKFILRGGNTNKVIKFYQ